jgi:hypothetical protein
MDIFRKALPDFTLPNLSSNLEKYTQNHRKEDISGKKTAWEW